jgi:hypothetical protein
VLTARIPIRSLEEDLTVEETPSSEDRTTLEHHTPEFDEIIAPHTWVGAHRGIPAVSAEK